MQPCITRYEDVIDFLKGKEYSFKKRVSPSGFDGVVCMELLVECSPILLLERLDELKSVFSGFDVFNAGINSGVGVISIVKK